MPRLPQDVLASFRVLYVEDNSDISEEVLFFLEPWVKELYNAANGVEGLEIFERERPDVIVTDIQMPKMNGLEMIRKIREHDSDIPIIITTAFNEIDFLFKALDLHVDGYLLKPLDFRGMLARLKKHESRYCGISPDCRGPAGRWGPSGQDRFSDRPVWD